MSILTDDERIQIARDEGDDVEHTLPSDIAFLKRYARAIEAAVLAKLREQKPVAEVELMKTGGNAGLSTRIVEIDHHLRERLCPGDKLYAAPVPAVGQVPRLGCKECAEWAQARKDDKEFRAGVERGRQVIADLAAAAPEAPTKTE